MLPIFGTGTSKADDEGSNRRPSAWALAGSSQLKRNLKQQVEVYEPANRTWTPVKVIVSCTA